MVSTANGKSSGKAESKARQHRGRIATAGGSDRYFGDSANRYARQVVAGKIIACKWVTLACQRHLRDLEKSASAEYAYKFSYKAASRPCRFIELLPHVKGEWARVQVGYSGLIKLEPWQIFITCAIFGWVSKDTGYRRFAEAYIKVARKNAKTTWAAGIGDFMLVADREYGPEVYAGATTKKQAMEVFRTARRMAKKAPRFREYFDLEINIESIVTRRDDGKFEPLIGDPGDGASPSCAIIDEYHEHPTANLHDTMVTGMGARRQGLTLIITTAGTDTASPCYLTEKDCEKILEGLIEDDSYFCIMYSADEGDPWDSVAAQRKANPNWGVSVFPEYLDKQLRAARQSPHKRFIYSTKHLDLWGNAPSSYFDMVAWAACKDEKLSIAEFKGMPCWMGNDLAAQTDLASRIKIFQRMLVNDAKLPKEQQVLVRHYYIFGIHYAPLDRILDGDHVHYENWYSTGKLTGVPGSEIQLSTIQKDIEAELDRYDFQRIAFDPWSALQMQQQLEEQLGADVVISVGQNAKVLSPPMKELDAAMRSGRLHHDGDPVLAWAISCVLAKIDANDNVFPRKLENGKDKIDPATALITGLQQAMSGEIKRRFTRPMIGIL